jgi:hypothetical protein
VSRKIQDEPARRSAMTELRRLTPDERFQVALTHRAQRVQVETVSTTGNRTAFAGWVTSVANLRHGTTEAVLVLRTDRERIDKDLAFSLAQISTITPLDPTGQPLEQPT